MKDFHISNAMTDIIEDFSWTNVKYIYEVNYHQERNMYFEHISVVYITFIILTKQNSQYKLNMKFSEVESFTLYAGTPLIQLILFEILDMKDDGWNTSRYWIRDVESDNLKFYCNNIEIVSIEKNDESIYL